MATILISHNQLQVFLKYLVSEAERHPTLYIARPVSLSDPSVEPRNVVVSQFGKDKLVVAWDRIDENFAGGPIKSYVIHLSQLFSVMTLNEARNVTVLGVVGTTAVLNGVSSDTWYKVEVSAVTVSETGTELKGPFSKTVRIKTPAAASTVE